MSKTFKPFSFPQDTLKSLDPFTIGFDKLIGDFENTMKTVSKNIPTYPPYNIKQVSENKYVIEMAVAGFAKTDIEITLEGNKLVIEGASKEAEDAANYLFKGIANRNFQRVFTLADKIEIKDAEIANGMLKVWLENIVKVNESIKKITINEAQ